MVKKYLNRFANWSVVVGILIIVCGLFVLSNPESAIRTAFTLAGALMIFSGVFHIFIYVKADDYFPHMTGLIPQEALCIALGILLITFWDKFAGILPRLICVLLVIYGLFRVFFAFLAKSFGDQIWWLNLILGVILMFCGCWYFSLPGITTLSLLLLISIFMIFTGISVIAEALGAKSMIANMDDEEESFAEL